MSELNIGLIGYRFMGKVHSHAYREVDKFFALEARPVLKAICGRSEEPLRQAAAKWGWEGHETSWERLVERDDIDVIDISTSNEVHCEIAVAAAEHGKHILCEKPMAMTVAEAERMAEAAQRHGVTAMVGFNYRRVPAVALAKRLIEEGRLGDIYHFRAVYLQDWLLDPEFPLLWRMQKERAGSGALGDLAAHIIDIAHFLVGEIEAVNGMMETFVTERPLPGGSRGDKLAGEAGGGEKGKVTVDDAAAFLARFESGALGSFEVSRFAAGRLNGQHFEVNGTKGSLVFDLERLNELQVYFVDEDPDIQGFRTISVTKDVHPYIEAWWPPGHINGYQHTFVHQAYDFLSAVANGTDVQPDFSQGLENQRVLDAVERSAAAGNWESVHP